MSNLNLNAASAAAFCLIVEPENNASFCLICQKNGQQRPSVNLQLKDLTQAVEI